jgi:hypothetical protein
MTECLHCEINQLVRERMESSHADLAELASMMVESLADLVLLAPGSEQPKLIAYALSAFGQMLLEKSGAAEEAPTLRTRPLDWESSVEVCFLSGAA